MQGTDTLRRPQLRPVDHVLRFFYTLLEGTQKAAGLRLFKRNIREQVNMADGVPAPVPFLCVRDCREHCPPDRAGTTQFLFKWARDDRAPFETAIYLSAATSGTNARPVNAEPKSLAQVPRAQHCALSPGIPPPPPPLCSAARVALCSAPSALWRCLQWRSL
jgi:hypothetical protein